MCVSEELEGHFLIEIAVCPRTSEQETNFVMVIWIGIFGCLLLQLKMAEGEQTYANNPIIFCYYPFFPTLFQLCFRVEFHYKTGFANSHKTK